MACKSCGGEGSSPHIEDDEHHFEITEEPCPECFERGICPRCDNADAFVSDETGEQCGHCGWRV
jgi:DnaJ-class molecular chaperone